MRISADLKSRAGQYLWHGLDRVAVVIADLIGQTFPIHKIRIEATAIVTGRSVGPAEQLPLDGPATVFQLRQEIDLVIAELEGRRCSRGFQLEADLRQLDADMVRLAAVRDAVLLRQQAPGLCSRV